MVKTNSLTAKKKEENYSFWKRRTEKTKENKNERRNEEFCKLKNQFKKRTRISDVQGDIFPEASSYQHGGGGGAAAALLSTSYRATAVCVTLFTLSTLAQFP